MEPAASHHAATSARRARRTCTGPSGHLGERSEMSKDQEVMNSSTQRMLVDFIADNATKDMQIAKKALKGRPPLCDK